MIASEFDQPIEEVATWNWRKRELYAHALSAQNQYERLLSERERENYDHEQASSQYSGHSSDTHPALRKYSNVANIQNDDEPDAATSEP